MKWITTVRGEVLESNDCLNEGIFYYTAVVAGKKGVRLPVIADDEKKAEKELVKKIKMHQKNGRLPEGEITDIKLSRK